MSEIYQAVLQLSVGFRRRGNWAFLPQHSTVRQLPQDTNRILAGLRERFSDDELERAGVLARTDSGGLQFCDNLETHSRIVVFLRAAPDSTPHDVLTSSGSLAGQDVPCLTAAADAYTAEGLENWRKRLFVAFSIHDLAILRSLGLPTTLGSGLGQLDGMGLRLLLGQPQGLAQGAADSCDSVPAPRQELWNSGEKLVLVGWSVASLSLQKPRGLQAVTALFGGARRCCSFDTSRIMVWRPTRSQFQQIEFAVGLRDVQLVWQAIANSVASSLHPIEHFANDNPAVPAHEEFRRAREALMAELRREQEQQLLSFLVPRLLQEYNRAYERAFVDPLVRKATADDSPIDKAVWLAASELVQQLHNRSALVTGCAEHALRTRVPWAASMDMESQKQYLAIVDRLVAIVRAWRK